jgi:hypothetical protein
MASNNNAPPQGNPQNNAPPQQGNTQPGLGLGGGAKKTTPDEGREFGEGAVFECVQDCWQGGARYRRGDTLAGRKCPPWFRVRPGHEGGKKK